MSDVDRRACRMALVMLALGALALIGAYGMAWASAPIPLVVGVDTSRIADIPGRDLQPSFTGWVALAGVAGIIATRSWARVVVGALVAVTGAVAVGYAFAFAAVPGPAVEDVVAGTLGDRVPLSVSVTGWWALAALGGALVLYAGAWTVLRGRSWPALGSRYERSRAGEARPSAWDALDRGEDPTDPPGEAPGDAPGEDQRGADRG